MNFLEHFNYQITGNQQGPKLVFLHGLLGAGHNWRRIIPHFEPHFQVLAYDQRGHGRSFQPEKGYSPEDFAQDLLLILDELSWGQIHLVGHSLGGRNALCFASLYPERVAKLVLVDIGPELPPDSDQQIQQILQKVPVPFSSREEAQSSLKASFPPSLAQFLYTNIEKKESGLYDWRFFKPGILQALEAGRSRSRWEEVRALQVPTLVIRGQKSETLTSEVFQRMLHCNSLVEGVEILGAGHWVHADQPEELTRLLKQFLQDGGDL